MTKNNAPRTSGKANSPRLEVIDGLRALAVSIVFGAHLYEIAYRNEPAPRAELGPLDFTALLARGAYGVDLFFFLSGFCLFYPYAQAYFGERPMPTLAHFAYARAIKILPSYYIVIAGVILVGYPSFYSAQDAYWQVGLHLVFLHVLFTDSFGTVLGPAWSLGVEAQFYLIFPILGSIMLRSPLVTALLALAFGTLERAQYAPSWFDSRQFPLEIDTFVTGMLAAYLYRALSRQYAHIAHSRRAWAWTLLAIGGISLYVMCSQTAYIHRDIAGYNRYVLPLLDVAFLSVTLGSLFGGTIWQSIMGNPLFIFYAQISYNFYLWHCVIRDELLRHGFPTHGVSFVFLNLFCSTLLAALLTYGIERPLMRLRPFLKPVHTPTS